MATIKPFDNSKYLQGAIPVETLDNLANAVFKNAAKSWLDKVIALVMLMAGAAYIIARSKLIDNQKSAECQDLEQDINGNMDDQNEVVT